MLNKIGWILALAITGLAASAGSSVQLKVGSVGVATHQLTQQSCIQIPIFINDPLAPRAIRDLTITVDISGDTAIIDGSIAQGMVVANGFSNDPNGGTALTNPGTDLTDVSSSTTPTSSLIFNSATQTAAIHSFELGNMNGAWTVNNNLDGVGRKQGFVFNAGAMDIGTTATTDQLVMVLEIPIIADPGPSVLDITATPDAVVADGNSYTLNDGGLVQELFDTVQAMGSLIIMDATHTGLYRPANGSFYLDSDGDGSFNISNGDKRYLMGGTGDVPVIGDWNDDGRDEIGIYRASNRNFYLDTNASGGFNAGDVRFPMGATNDIPIAGRWPGSPTIGDSVGLRRPIAGGSLFFLDIDGDYAIDLANGDVRFPMGARLDIPIVGDWDGDGFDNVGLYRATSPPQFFLDANSNFTIDLANGDIYFKMGANTDIALGGDWNNSGQYTIGLRRPSTSQFFLDMDGNGAINLATGDKRLTWGGSSDVPISGIW